MATQKAGALAAPFVLVKVLAATLHLAIAFARRYPYLATVLLIAWAIATKGKGW